MSGKTGVHSQATYLQATGFQRPGFPGMGFVDQFTQLGSENENLPTFVVFAGSPRVLPVTDPKKLGLGVFLPTGCQGNRDFFLKRNAADSRPVLPKENLVHAGEPSGWIAVVGPIESQFFADARSRR